MILGPDLSGEELYTVEQTGTIKVNGTLSGVVMSASLCGLHFDVNELNRHFPFVAPQAVSVPGRVTRSQRKRALSP
jgi:hypothetical protein